MNLGVYQYMSIISGVVDRIAVRSFFRAFIFPMVFLMLATVFEGTYTSISDSALNQFYLNYLADASAFLINWSLPNENVNAYQNFITSAHAQLEISRTCSGSSPFFFLVAAILAFSGATSDKMIGVVCSALLVVFLNQIRILSLYLTMAYIPDKFLLLHFYVAPMVMISCCCVFFIWWAFYALGKNHG